MWTCVKRWSGASRAEIIYHPPLSLAAGRKIGLLDYYTCEYVEPDEDDDITEELTVMLPRLHASNTMSVDELLNPPEENVLIEDPTDEDFCRVDTNSENKTRSELTQPGRTTKMQVIPGQRRKSLCGRAEGAPAVDGAAIRQR
ncbi:hypothetical protein PC123_g1850 [Phytophthora cactorum]|nr:hypothetical protein PC123_g1850 [Phytophthora cactorum]